MTEQKERSWIHNKWEECESCDLNALCAGVWMRKAEKKWRILHQAYYDFVQYKPQKLTQAEKEKIITTIQS